MKLGLSLLLLLSVFAGAHVSAQRRTVTNAELEKFKQKRLQAEQDYNDNFDRMGFPSPEELQRQIEQGRADSLALSERLAAERIERERLQIERDRLAIERENLALERQAMEYANRPDYSPLNDGYYGLGFPGYYNFGGHGRPYRGFGSSRFRGPAVNIGNGIPLVNYYGRPTGVRPVFRVHRRR